MVDTVEDFWRMIWEQNATVVVMLTKLEEKGRVSPHFNSVFLISSSPFSVIVLSMRLSVCLALPSIFCSPLSSSPFLCPSSFFHFVVQTRLLFAFQILFQIRCQRYWPDEGELREYGLIKIHLQSQVINEMYTVRTFNIQHEGVSGEKIVRQFHYTAWPEFGVPKDMEAVVLFVKLLMKENQPDVGPMIIHCRLVPFCRVKILHDYVANSAGIK